MSYTVGMARLTLRLDFAPGQAVGHGKIRLLEAVRDHGSISAAVPRPSAVAYTATKHAVTGLTRQLALEGRPFNIACGQIDIGNAATAMTDHMVTGALQADGSVVAEPVMDVTKVADTVLHIANLPIDVNVLFTTVMANGMPYVGRG